MALINKTPLLIICNPSGKHNIFIHFSEIASIQDELDLKNPCHFSLHVKQGSEKIYKFSLGSSTEYLEWIRHLRLAHESSFCLNLPAKKSNSLKTLFSRKSFDTSKYVERFRRNSLFFTIQDHQSIDTTTKELPQEPLADQTAIHLELDPIRN